MKSILTNSTIAVVLVFSILSCKSSNPIVYLHDHAELAGEARLYTVIAIKGVGLDDSQRPLSPSIGEPQEWTYDTEAKIEAMKSKKVYRFRFDKVRLREDFKLTLAIGEQFKAHVSGDKLFVGSINLSV